MIKPFNDNLLVEVQKSQWATADEEGDQQDPRAGSGQVVAIPAIKDILYFGSFNWAFDQSMLNKETAEQVHDIMRSLLGKTVYFEKHADRGMTVEHGDSTFIVLKLSKIIGYTDK